MAGNLHSTSSTLDSILFASPDSGETWKEAAPRIRGAALDQLQFYDLRHGWAAGEAQYPLPHDPFFLVSTDGGDSWRAKPVTSGGGNGSVQEFSFDSAQHGELIVAASGRFTLYESQTGGESWMIRGTTGERPRLKNPPQESDAWRLRPDADGKAWQLEKNENDQWRVAATFPIEVARCQ